MAVSNSVEKRTFGNDVQILIAPEQAFTIGCLVGNTGITADSEGKKILKAGTPVGASASVLTNRQTVLAKATGETAQGVVLHDVDVTAGDANATLVVEGVIDLKKLDEATATALTTAAANLPKITVMNGIK